MPAYDDYFFDPPAPLAKITLRGQEHDTILPDVSRLLDSGADVTLIPQDAVHVLGVSVSPNESYELRGFDGHTSFVQVVQLDLIFLRKTFRGRFLVINQEWGILGRDVLNHVSVLLDGPHLTWNEQRSSGS